MIRDERAGASTLWMDLERIQAGARTVNLGRSILTGMASILYVLGWLAGRALFVAILASRWLLAAAAIGWRDARATTRRPGG